MRNPFVQYLVGACILSIGLIILLSSSEIAHGLTRFWEHWLGRSSVSKPKDPEQSQNGIYRSRLVMWRVLGALIVADGLIWLALASAEVMHLLPLARR